jgi:hypothetical protein
MKWRAVCVMIISAITIAAGGACGQSPKSAACSAGHTPYSAGDIALELVQDDSGYSFRLPLGEIVTGAVGWCASGNALEPLGNELPSSTPGRGHGAAFRAVKIGVADLYLDSVCSEACFKGFRAKITVTNGCEILPRTEAAKLFSTPNTSWITVTSTSKLIQARDYERVFAPLLDVPPDKLVWAVLVSGRINLGAVVDPSPGRIMWAANAVDPCTDHTLGRWEGTSQPPGMSSLTDQSPN